MPLANRLAWRYRRSNDAHDDLFQGAYVGLVKAVDRFDPEHGAKFSSFAVPSVLGELRQDLAASHPPRAPDPGQPVAASCFS